MTLRSSAEALILTLGLSLALGCSPEAPLPGEGASGAPGGPGPVGSGGGGGGGAGNVVGAAGSNGAAGASTAGSGPGTGMGGMVGVAGATTGGAAGASGAGPVGGESGNAGSGGMDPGGMYTVPRGMSAGCGKNPPGGDNPNGYTKHDIMVTGVDPQFIADHPSNPGNNGGYTYTMRNYYVRLPANYDPGTAYPVTFGGGGCGNTGGDSGKGGGQQASNIDSIKIGLSYVYSGGACFEDQYANTPEIPYFDAVIKEVSANYCVNLEKVFAGGYSSGAWESATLGLARGGVIRGIATGAGGLRANRPPPSDVPIAAILLTGQGDGANPIDGPTGSAALRDHILMKNGCQGTATMPFTASDQNCVEYTGCPAAFPVIWCTPPGGHTGGSNMHWAAVGTFWNGLPPIP